MLNKFKRNLVTACVIGWVSSTPYSVQNCTIPSNPMELHSAKYNRKSKSKHKNKRRK